MKKHEIAVALVFSLIIGLVGGTQYALSSTGNQNSFSLNWLEVPNINATYYYLNDVNITDELGGAWDHGALSGLADDDHSLYYQSGDAATFATVDTGEGANELYDMDQNVLTTSDVLFNDLNVTSDFYLNSVNMTGRLGGDWDSTDLVTTGQLNASGVDVDWIDLGGSNRTVWPTSGSGSGLEEHPFSQLVFINATATYRITGGTGAISSNADSRTIIQEAFDASPGGSVHIKNGSYIISGTPLYLDGSVHRSIKITGDGWERGSGGLGTKFVLGTIGMDILNITNLMKVTIEGMAFDCDSKAGNGIYAFPTGGSDYVIEGSYFNDLYFRGITAGYSGMHIYDAMYYSMGHILIDTNGNGLTFQESSYRNTGNSKLVWAYIRMYGDDGIGIYIYTNGTKRSNLIEFGWVQVYGDYNNDANENNTAVWLYNADHNKFEYLVVESMSNGVHLDGNSKANIFDGGYMTAAIKAFESESTTEHNEFRSFHAWTNIGTSPVLIDDASTYENFYENIRTNSAGGGYTGANVFQDSTILKGQIQNKTYPLLGWLLPDLYGGSSQAGTVNRTSFNWIRVPHATLIDNVVFRCEGISAGQSFKLSMYADMGGTPEGGALLWSSGDFMPGGTGAYNVTVNPPVWVPSGIVWTGISTEDTVMDFARAGGTGFFGASAPDNAMGGAYFTQSSWGALPDPCPAVTVSEGDTRPSIFIHADNSAD